MNWAEAHQALKDGAKVSRPCWGEAYLDRQEDGIAFHKPKKGTSMWKHWFISYGDVMLFLVFNDFYIKEANNA